jgi:hypothetical protein
MLFVFILCWVSRIIQVHLFMISLNSAYRWRVMMFRRSSARCSFRWLTFLRARLCLNKAVRCVRFLRSKWPLEKCCLLFFCSRHQLLLGSTLLRACYARAHTSISEVGGFTQPGNLNGSCVRDPVAGLFIVNSPPVPCPLALLLDFVLRNQIKSCSAR